MGREGAKGEGISLLCSASASPLWLEATGFSLHTLSQFLAPYSTHPPALPPFRVCRRGAAASAQPRAPGEAPGETAAAAVGVCVCVKDATSRSCVCRRQRAAGLLAPAAAATAVAASGVPPRRCSKSRCPRAPPRPAPRSPPVWPRGLGASSRITGSKVPTGML